jgi:uncharacterized protein (TIGR02001 family)
MRNLRILAVLGLVATAGAAQADVTSTIGLVSDYDFRGWTQTDEKPAVQGSIDYAHESGWYAGVWGSNVDGFSDGGLNTASTEVDFYTGFKGKAADLGWDAGIVYYTYAGASDINYAEIYGKLSYNIFSGGVFYSNDFGGKYPGGSSDNAYYVYGEAAIPAGPLVIGLHAGYSDGDGIETTYFAGTGKNSYADYSVGVSYTASNITLGFKWVARDVSESAGGSDDRVILSISTALPWSQ